MTERKEKVLAVFSFRYDNGVHMISRLYDTSLSISAVLNFAKAYNKTGDYSIQFIDYSGSSGCTGSLE